MSRKSLVRGFHQHDRAMRGEVADELPHDVPFVRAQLPVDGDLGVELVQGLRVLDALLAARGSELQGSSRGVSQGLPPLREGFQRILVMAFSGSSVSILSRDACQVSSLASVNMRSLPLSRNKAWEQRGQIFLRAPAALHSTILASMSVHSLRSAMNTSEFAMCRLSWFMKITTSNSDIPGKISSMAMRLQT